LDERLHFEDLNGGIAGAFEIREAVGQRVQRSAAVTVRGEREASGQRGRDRASRRHATFIGRPARLRDRVRA
jgi:hypothetical protein